MLPVTSNESPVRSSTSSIASRRMSSASSGARSSLTTTWMVSQGSYVTGTSSVSGCVAMNAYTPPSGASRGGDSYSETGSVERTVPVGRSVTSE